MIAEERGTRFEHCVRGIDQSIALTGEQGRPLVGTGDWNDGMNRVGEGSRGESVWLGRLQVRTIVSSLPWRRRGTSSATADATARVHLDGQRHAVTTDRASTGSA